MANSYVSAMKHLWLGVSVCFQNIKRQCDLASNNAVRLNLTASLISGKVLSHFFGAGALCMMDDLKEMEIKRIPKIKRTSKL